MNKHANPLIVREAENIIYVNFDLIASFPEDDRTLEKQSVLRRLMSDSMVQIVIDTRTKGVDVPDHLRGDPTLKLNLSHMFGLPFRSDRHAIWADLTFQGKPYSCIIPWAALQAVTSHTTYENIGF